MQSACSFVLSLVLLTCASAQVAAPSFAETILSKYSVAPNITYLTANNTELKLDIYRPKAGTAPNPTVIYIHGGGWVAGAKEGAILFLLPYMEMGFSVVNVEYRLAHTSLAPAAVEDCRCALRWVIQNAEKYQFDKNKIILAGESAGGHLALMTAMLPAAAGFDRQCPAEASQRWTTTDKTEPRVAAVVNWYGVTDVPDLLEGPNARGFAIEWFGSLPNREPLARQLSPMTYVRAGTSPIITIHGDHDPAAPYTHSVRLHEALKKAGVRNQLVTIPGGGHGGFSQEQLSTSFAAIREFLRAQNLLPPPLTSATQKQ